MLGTLLVPPRLITLYPTELNKEWTEEGLDHPDHNSQCKLGQVMNKQINLTSSITPDQKVEFSSPNFILLQLNLLLTK